MSKLDIRIYPDRVLRNKVNPVKKIGVAERALACDMIETMREANGVGLAAPQVGIKKRIIVVVDDENSKSAIVLVNPKILRKKGKSKFCEGCLSVPGVTADIVRPEHIEIEALNIDGEVLKIDTEGLLARVIQHEIDHLDGILFIDRISFFKRKRIMKQFSKKVCMKL